MVNDRKACFTVSEFMSLENEVLHQFLPDYDKLDDTYYSSMSKETADNMRKLQVLFRYRNILHFFQGCYSEEEINQRTERNFSNYKLLERTVAFESHCTKSSDTMELFKFQKDDIIKDGFYNMYHIFSNVRISDEIYVEDPAFYRNNEVFFSICSHEQMATLEIRDDEYEEFKKLDIPHIDTSNMWWLDEYEREWGGDNLFPFVEHRGQIGGINGYDPMFPFQKRRNYTERKAFYLEYKNKLNITLTPVHSLIEILKERYNLECIDSKEYKDLTRRNVLFNTSLARYILNSEEIQIEIYQIVKDKKSEHLYCIQQSEHEEIEGKKAEAYLDYKSVPYSECPIIIGIEYNSYYIWVEGSEGLKDEIVLIRGLDERELRREDLIENYVDALISKNQEE